MKSVSNTISIVSCMRIAHLHHLLHTAHHASTSYKYIKHHTLRIKYHMSSIKLHMCQVSNIRLCACPFLLSAYIHSWFYPLYITCYIYIVCVKGWPPDLQSRYWQPPRGVFLCWDTKRSSWCAMFVECKDCKVSVPLISDELWGMSDDFLHDFTGFSQVSNDGRQSVGLKGAIGAAIHKASQARTNPWEGTISNKAPLTS